MADRIRVAMVGRYPRVEGKPIGGPESVGEVLAKGLSESGACEMHFITGVMGLKEPEKRIATGGVNVTYVPMTRRFAAYTNYFIDCKRLRATVKEIAPDIVHVHGTAGPYARAVLDRGWPSVLAVRGIYFREIQFVSGLSRLKWLYGAKFERAALRKARNLVFLNHYTHRTVEHLIGEVRVRYIDNPADDSFFDLVSDEEKDRLLLLAVVRRLKGHEFAIRAVARLVSEGRPVNLHCVGWFLEKDYCDEINQLVEELGIGDHIHFEDHVNRDRVLEHYSKASVVVLPSLIENAPLAVSEGSAAGKPIVATPAGGVPEMIEDGKNGRIVPFSDSDSLADAIADLLDSPGKRAEMGRAARVSADQRYRIGVSVEKTLSFYREILGSAS